ncbi:PKD domain-containing protein, partial [Reichenbachiella sp.]
MIPSNLILKFSLGLMGWLLSSLCLAQTNMVNKDVEIFIPEGAKMFISGSYTDNSTSEIERLTIGGELEIQGDFVNNATSSNATISDKDFVMGKIKFTGSELQTIKGNDGVKFRVLEIDKPTNDLVIENKNFIKDTLMLTSGDLKLNGGKLCLLEETNTTSGVVSYSSIKKGNTKVSTSNGGFLQVEKSIQNAGDNPADIMGIGLGINVVDGQFEDILVRRTHGELTNVGNGYAALRNYSLVCGEQVDIDGIYFQHTDEELDPMGTDELAIYMSKDSLQSWQRLGGTKVGDTFIYSGDIALEAGINYGFAIASKTCDTTPKIGYTASASNDYEDFTRDINNYNFDICEGELLEIEPYDSLGTTLYYAEFTYPDDNVVSQFQIEISEENIGDFEVLARSTAGCESNSHFILNSKPSPVKVINASPTTTICFGQEVEYSHPGTNDEGGTMSSPSYVWDFGDAGVTSDGDPDQAVRHWTYDVYGHKRIAVKVTSEHQCTSSDTVSYAIAPIPEFDFTFADVCREETAQFDVVIADTITVNNDESFGTRRSFIWTYGDGKKDTTKNLFNAPVSFDHLYTGIDGILPVKLEMVFETSGCRDSVSHDIFIKPKPVAVFEPQFKNIYDDDVCVGEIVTFNNTTYISDASDLSYVWNFDDAENSFEQTPLHQYAGKGDYDVNLFVTSDVHGCTDEITHTVTVFPDPIGGFTIDETDICLDEVAKFTNETSILDSDPNLTYLWDFGDGSTSTEFEPEYLYTVPGIYQVDLTRTSKNGCQNKITRTHNIHPEPVADFVIVNACVDDPALFVSNSSILYDEISLYEWTFHDGTDEGDEVSHIYTDDTERDVTLYIESSFGCDATITQTISPAKRPTFNMSPIVTCESEFVIDPEDGTDKYLPVGSSFEWTNSDGLILSNSQTVLVDQGGLYSVNILGPAPLQCQNEEVVSIFVFDPIDLGDDITFCKEGNLEAELTHPMASSSSISETYAWFHNEGELMDETDQTLFVDEAGTYRMEVEYTVSGVGSCEVTDEVIVQIDPEFVVTVSDEQLCAGETMDLDAGVIGADYQWYDLSDGSNIGTNQTVEISESGRYRVEVTKSSCFAAAESMVNFYKPAVVDFYRPEIGICVGEDILFSNYSFVTEPASSIAAYEWDFGDGSPISNEQHPTKSYDSEGTYTVSLSVLTSEGCSYSQAYDLEIDAFPVPDFTVADACVGESIDLLAPAITGASYSWNY